MKNIATDIERNKNIAAFEIEKIIWKLNLELKNADLSEKESELVKKDIFSLNFMVRNLSHLHVLSNIQTSID